MSLLDTIWSLKKEFNKIHLAWALDSSRDSQDSEEFADSWLPKPQWSYRPHRLSFPSLTALEIFLQEIQAILGDNLQHYHYNTVGNFLAFYNNYKKQGRPPLKEFFFNYKAQILRSSLSCVGLSNTLIEHIINSDLSFMYPQLKCSLFLASCEEIVMDVESYCIASPPNTSTVVKEHVLAACKIRIGDRKGIIILDPGYHVGISVIAMADGLYPHTGWFVQSETEKSKKEYCYRLKGEYVHWTVRETRNGIEKTWCNLIYIERKFLSHISVSEKRNLVFNFRTLVARDARQPVAGLYCNMEGEEKFTLFFKNCFGKRVECKIPFSYINSCRTNNEFESALENCAIQIKCNTTLLVNMMQQLIEAYYDTEFIIPVREINTEIDED